MCKQTPRTGVGRCAVVTALCIASMGAVFASASSEWDGSKTVPVHTIPLYGEDEQLIVPEYKQSLPMSAKVSCGTCHDYEAISKGHHFNAMDASAAAGRPGEPWVWVDEKTGTQIPISSRDWPGSWQPEDIGMSRWDFAKTFGRHSPGGIEAGAGTDIDTESRWEVSGQLEINCLGCHNASRRQDMSEWAMQIERENFRWAATAAAGIGDVGGMASRIWGTWSVYDGPNRDDPDYAVPPYVKYDTDKFDRKHRCQFSISTEPRDASCLHCHSATTVGSVKSENPGDVHSSSGLTCVKCHSNGIDHNISRGYEGETKASGCPKSADTSCRACHIRESGTQSAMLGRHGAPVAKHQGMPEVHLEEIACTTCHSGPWPGESLSRVRTSRANRMGIHGAARWFTDAPAIVEPVFLRGESGKIEPHRMMWPAFWASTEGDSTLPVDPDDIMKIASDLLQPAKQSGNILATFATDPDAKGIPVLVLNGKIYKENVDGELELLKDDSIDISGMTRAWWGRLVEGTVTPIAPEFDPEKFNPVDNPEDEDKEGVIIAAIDILGRDVEDGVVPVLVSGGKIFFKDEEGFIANTPLADKSIAATDRAVWAWETETGLTPFLSELGARSIEGTVSKEATLTEEQVSAVLARLGENHSYVSSGKLFQRAKDGGLVASDHPVAAPVSWALAHDVRPAAQSLGANGCTDCHATGSPFFFANIQGLGPLQTASFYKKAMHELQGIDDELHELYGRAFVLRRWLGIALVAACALVGAVVLLFALAGLSRLLKLVSREAA